MGNTPDIMLRPAVDADLPGIRSLFRSTVMQVCAGDYDASQLQAWASSADDPARWQKLLDTTELIVAVAGDGRLAGFAALERPSHIEMMYAGKDFQGMGVAARLLHRLLSQTTGPVTAHVSRTARPFFEKHGFSVTEARFPVRNGIVIPNFAMTKP
ncbi:GNAT family N-acetyltransferase [Chitinophaga caseinilytica]|uniref:GNAT family N-acetyltransferase n=1 Tax=Chitinophaga caseinilytica TaxID=2267521 RepID=A0ABZ2Z2L8_9BACT